MLIGNNLGTSLHKYIQYQSHLFFQALHLAYVRPSVVHVEQGATL